MSWEKHTHVINSKWFRFIIAKIYNILRYVIPRMLRHMGNLHIIETEISQKRSKGIKNWKITYSVILSVLPNKTNLILGFSSSLNYCHPSLFFPSPFQEFNHTQNSNMNDLMENLGKEREQSQAQMTKLVDAISKMPPPRGWWKYNYFVGIRYLYKQKKTLGGNL